MKKFTIVIQEHLDLFVLKPYVEELRKRGVKLYFVVDDLVKNDAKSILKNHDKVISLNELANKNKISKKLHQLIRLIFTSKDFSYLYKKNIYDKCSKKIKILNRLVEKLIPFKSGGKINDTLRFLRILKNPFPTNKVLYVTKIFYPHLFCAPGLEIYTLLGSWDHPGKFPVGHPSKKVFVWNKSLKEDWIYFQGNSEEHISYSYPVLHKYVLSAKNGMKNIPDVSSGLTFMYPATFSSWSKEGSFEEELILLEALCKETKKYGHKLFIKPKPNSKKSEFDYFKRYPNVEIGKYSDSNNSNISKFVLSDSYNNSRLEELNKSDVVINLGTTFALDAAAYGLPVIQLLMNNEHSFPNLSRIQYSPHLARHYYSKKDFLFELNHGSNLTEQFTFLSNSSKINTKAESYSRYLREWLNPVDDFDNAIQNVADICLD